MMKIVKMTFAVACVSVLTGCCFCKKYQRLYGRPLEETRWTLVQMDGRPVDGNYVLVFSTKGQMAISGGTSTVTAGYKAFEDGFLTLTDLSVGGAGAGGANERRLMEMLRQTTNYKMDGRFLMFTIKGGEMWALFEAKDPKEPETTRKKGLF